LHELVPGLFGNVMTIGAYGRRLRALTTFVGGEVHGVVGSYSPDGRWIVYREQHPDRAPLMIMRPDGRHARTILNLPGVVTRFIDWGPHRTANARDTH
jgi:Tol biopolymer transport system component